MKCPDEKALIDWMAGETTGPEKHELDEHLAACDQCAKAVQALRQTESRIQSWKPNPLPKDLHGLVMSRVRRENTPADAPSFLRWLWLEARPALCGIALAVIWIFLHTASPTQQTSGPQAMLFCGVVWGAAYNSLFRLIFTDRLKKTLMDWKIAGVAGLCALSLAMLIAAVTPNPPSFETRRWYASVAPHIPEWVAILLPALYSLISLLIVGIVIAVTQKVETRRLILASGIVYSVLMTLDLWMCYLLDMRLISIPLLAIWITSVWAVSLALSWTLGRLCTK